MNVFLWGFVAQHTSLLFSLQEVPHDFYPSYPEDIPRQAESVIFICGFSCLTFILMFLPGSPILFLCMHHSPLCTFEKKCICVHLQTNYIVYNL